MSRRGKPLRLKDALRQLAVAKTNLAAYGHSAWTDQAIEAAQRQVAAVHAARQAQRAGLEASGLGPELPSAANAACAPTAATEGDTGSR